jgi:hypothetical protein
MSFPEEQIHSLVFGPYTITNINANTIVSRVFKFLKPGEITYAGVVAGTAITGNTANAKYIGVMNATNASAITAYARTNFIDSVDLAANTVTALVTNTELTFAANDILAINISGTNAAGNLDKCYVIVQYVYGSPAGAL